MMSAIPVMNTKLLPPQTRTHLIDRPRLLNLFSQAPGWRAVLVTAPAGYGKTVFMTQLAAAIPKPLVWYQLDDYDNDPAVFIQYLITGIREHLPGFGEKACALANQGESAQRLRLLTTLIANELNEGAKQGLTLVLDDYHAINEPFIHQLVQEFLEHLPDNIILLAASRSQPPFSLARATLSGKILTVKAAELRFTRPEMAAAFAAQHHHDSVSEQTLDLLETKTAGWPAILRFTGASVPTDAMLSGTGDTQTIYDYLVTEVLNGQPENIREFLLASSVLDVLTPQDCDLLLERNDSHQVLELLERQQLFLIPLTGNRKAYRFPQLFREFLLERLGEKRAGLRRRAGGIARQAGELDRAVEYFLANGYDHDLNETLKEACRKMLHQGRWQTVARWLDLLPVAVLLDDPWLSLATGQVEVYRGRLDQAAKWVAGAITGFNEGSQEGLLESQILQARIYRCRGQYQQALELLETLESALLPEGFNRRFDLPLEKSLCLNMTGRFKESEAVLTAALTVAEKKTDRYVIAHLLEGLGTVNYFLGNFPKSLQFYKKAAELSTDQILPSYYTQDSISTIYQDWGEFDQAFEYARRSVIIKEELGIHEALPSAYLQLASIYEDRNDLAAAESYYQKATKLLQENGEWFYLVLNLTFLSRCLGMQGRWVEARATAEKALTEARLRSGSLALAVCQVVTAPILIQTGSIYEGSALLREGISSFEEMGFLKALSYGYANLAWINLIENDKESAFQNIEKSLQIASRINFFQYFLTYWTMLLPAIKLALERGVEVTFIQRVLVRMGQRSLGFLAQIAAHPDPQIRVRSIAPLLEIGGPQSQKIINLLLNDRQSEVKELTRLVTDYSRRSVILKSNSVKNEFPLQIKMLGSFKLIIGTNLEPVKWRTLKTRDLLAYLIHYGEAVSKERILEDLWPDIDLKNATDLFHATSHYLRRLLTKLSGNEELLIYSNKSYQIVLNNFCSDRQEFQFLIATSAKSTMDPHTAGSLEKAISLYRGDYLAELDYSWLIPEQEHLKRLYTESRLRLSHYYLQTKEYSQAIQHLKTLEEISPLSEEIHCLLMTVFTEIGNHSSHREQYHKLTKILKSELGIPPSPETVALYQKLRKK